MLAICVSNTTPGAVCSSRRGQTSMITDIWEQTADGRGEDSCCRPTIITMDYEMKGTPDCEAPGSGTTAQNTAMVSPVSLWHTRESFLCTTLNTTLNRFTHNCP